MCFHMKFIPSLYVNLIRHKTSQSVAKNVEILCKGLSVDRWKINSEAYLVVTQTSKSQHFAKNRECLKFMKLNTFQANVSILQHLTPSLPSKNIIKPDFSARGGGGGV